MAQILDQTLRRTLGERPGVPVIRNETLLPVMFFARWADMIRSNAFLWTEAALKVQERCSRATRLGLEWSRTSVLATVAADLAAGYISLQEQARWWPDLVRPEDWLLQHQRGANRLLDTMATLGGAMIKAGQFASTRPDLLPATYIHALSQLQDRLPPHDWPTIEAAITRELGRNLYDVFEQIEPEPVAAASIAQVHRARLRDGRQVAVKIQYPEVAELITADLAILEKIVAIIARSVPSIQLQPILDYLQATLPLELDFQHEANAIQELRAALGHRTDVLIPEVITQLSTRRLLAMEFIDGIKITDRVALQEAGISPREVAKLLNNLYAEQILRLGVLHADPHPGNLFVQPGPRLVLLDHGLTGRLEPSLIHSLAEMVQALVAGDFDALTRAMAGAGLQLDEQVDITTLLQLVGVLLGGERVRTARDIGPQLARILSRVPMELVLIGRALGLLDGITKQLDPDLNILESIACYV